MYGSLNVPELVGRECQRMCLSAGGRGASATHPGSTQVYLPWLLQNPQTMETFSKGEACRKTPSPERPCQDTKQEGGSPALLGNPEVPLWPTALCAALLKADTSLEVMAFIEHCMNLEFPRESKRKRCKTGWQPRDSEGQAAEPPEGGPEGQSGHEGTPKRLPPHRCC